MCVRYVRVQMLACSAQVIVMFQFIMPEWLVLIVSMLSRDAGHHETQRPSNNRLKAACKSFVTEEKPPFTTGMRRGADGARCPMQKGCSGLSGTAPPHMQLSTHA